jgi:hypothetical protein
MPVMYPNAMNGSWGFKWDTEWLFMTLHCLHVGLLKTCQRYTQLVTGLETEVDPRKLESLVKFKLCVDSQLLQPGLLRDSLSLYIFLARFMQHLIDPTRKGPPLSDDVPIRYAALPEYLIEDMADMVLFLARFNISVLSLCCVPS